MSDFDGAVQRPAGPEDASGSSPVGMADVDAGPPASSAESAVGMEDVPQEERPAPRREAPPCCRNTHVNVVGEGTGLTEAQVLGREPLPETES